MTEKGNGIFAKKYRANMGDATSIYSKPSISYSQVDHYRSMDRTDNNPVLTGNSMPGVIFLFPY